MLLIRLLMTSECLTDLYISHINTSRPVELTYTYFNQSGAYNCEYNRQGALQLTPK